MAYYDSYSLDPYGYANPYGYNDPYGYYQAVDNSPPPEPNKDWVDVPKINRSYVMKIPKDLIKKDFLHLKNESLFTIEAIVEYIELDEELSIYQETNEKPNGNIIARLKILNFPEINLPIIKRDETDETEKSVTSRDVAVLPSSEWLQNTLSYLARVANESEKEKEIEESQDKKEEIEGDEEDKERKSTLNGQYDEKLDNSEPNKRIRTNVMEGKSVIMLTTGLAMIHKLQAQNVWVAVEQSDIANNEVKTLGVATVRLPKTFQQAVLRRTATKSTFSVPLVAEEGEEVGEVGLVVTLVCLGQGVEVCVAEAPRIYGKVRLIDSFPPEAIESTFDPPVHPRLAVTLMNLEAPLSLNRTSSQIIKECLKHNLLLEDNDGYSKFKRRSCRWLEIAREITGTSKVSLKSVSSSLSTIDSSTLPKSSEMYSLLNCPRKRIDPELDLLWRKLRQQCKELGDESQRVDIKKKALFDELDALLLQDKGDGWKDEISSKSSNEEKRNSKSTRSSGRNSTKTSTKIMSK